MPLLPKTSVLPVRHGTSLFKDITEDLLWLRDPLSIARYMRALRRRLRQIGDVGGRKPVIIFQNGKVGSRSILSALSSRGWPALHAHNATHDWMKRAVEIGNPEATKAWAAERLAVVRVVQNLLRGETTTGLKIIVPFRDPIARSLSLCYHVAGVGNLGRESDEVALARLVSMYDQHFCMWVDATPWEARAFQNHDYFNGAQDSWYLRELRDGLKLGVDILGADMDLRGGFQIVSFGSTEVLFLKMETMDRFLAPALKMFLSLDFQSNILERQNVRQDKLYEMFCRRVGLSSSNIEKVLSSVVSAKLFSEAERETMRRKWVNS